MVLKWTPEACRSQTQQTRKDKEFCGLYIHTHRSAEQIVSQSMPRGPINNESGQASVQAFMTSVKRTEGILFLLFSVHRFTFRVKVSSRKRSN